MRRPDYASHVSLLDQAVLAGSIEAARVCLTSQEVAVGQLSSIGMHSVPQKQAEVYVARDEGARLAAL
eukprot:7116638-Heterocapsa_arctica.AAC.1